MATATKKAAPAAKKAAPARKAAAPVKKAATPAKKAPAKAAPAAKKVAPSVKKLAPAAKKTAPTPKAAPAKKAAAGGTDLKALWPKLHAGDAEPWPKSAAVLEAWQLFHAGDFAAALKAGLKAGGAGITAANKAQAIHATYVEKNEAKRQQAWLQIAERAEQQQQDEPDNPNAWYFQAYALGRYGQSISIAEALAQGLGTRIKAALERAIALQPKHADAHLALGTFHAEVVDKVGRLLARGQGADPRSGLEALAAALKLNPRSAITMIEAANGMVMIDGDKKLAEAEKLYQQAAACTPLDAMERFDVELAKSELED